MLVNFRETHKCHRRDPPHVPQDFSPWGGQESFWMLSQGLEESDSAHQTSRRAFEEEGLVQA